MTTNTTTDQQEITSMGNDRNDTIAAIKTALKARSDRTWSVRGGRGTAWGWITVIAPPTRCDQYGGMSDDDRHELTRLFALDGAHHQGISIPAQSDFREEYTARAEGRVPARVGVPQWD